MIKVGVSGAMGKMGRAIARVVAAQNDMKLVLALEKKGHAQEGQIYPEVPGGIKVSSDPEGIKDTDVLIDFSSPGGALENIRFCGQYKKNIVIGATGFTQEQMDSLKKYSDSIAVLISPNMSPGVNLLFSVLKKVSGILKSDYDVEIIDIHHRHKKDAPSGTAKKFASIIGDEYKKDVPVHSLRIGEVFGDHYIVFSGNKERIEFVHKAITRDVFAEGAVKAARFISGKKKGLFSMQDLLGL